MKGGAAAEHLHKQIIKNSLTCVENWEVSPLRAFFQSPIYKLFSILFLSLNVYSIASYIFFIHVTRQRILEHILTFFSIHILMF